MATALRVIGTGPFGEAVTQRLPGRKADTVERAFEEADLVVLALWRPSPALCERADRLAFGSGMPWLPIVMDTHAIQVGPLVRPGSGACYRCLEYRRRQHDTRPESTRALMDAYDADETLGPAGFLPQHARLGAALATRLWQDNRPSVVITIGLENLAVESHGVVPCHGCDRCGEPHIERDLREVLHV